MLWTCGRYHLMDEALQFSYQMKQGRKDSCEKYLRTLRMPHCTVRKEGGVRNNTMISVV